MHILHLIGISIIISLLATGAVFLVQIVKMEREILAEKNEEAHRIMTSEQVDDIVD